MKVLFISSGNSKYGISPIIKSQGESLIRQDVNLEYFPIKGKGFQSYFRHIFILRKFLQSNSFDIVHAHYSLSAYVASLAGANPLVVSLMGSDVKSNRVIKIMIHFFNFLFKWKRVIVKSQDLGKGIGLKNSKVIPNGVNIELFKPAEKFLSQEQLGWDRSKRHILFAANPNRPEKNFKLASQGFSLMNDNNIELHVLENIPQNEIPIWLNASDVVLLTSLWEGSPNVIKEAMACNRPIVATDVGDIRWLFGNKLGHYLASFNSNGIAINLKLALDYEHKKLNTNGRHRIIELGLDSGMIAKSILEVYKQVVQL